MSKPSLETIFDYHDWSVGHVTLERRGEDYFLYVGKRDLQFREGKFIGSGSMLSPMYRDCKKCCEEGFGGDQSYPVKDIGIDT